MKPCMKQCKLYFRRGESACANCTQKAAMEAGAAGLAADGIDWPQADSLTELAESTRRPSPGVHGHGWQDDFGNSGENLYLLRVKRTRTVLMEAEVEVAADSEEEAYDRANEMVCDWDNNRYEEYDESYDHDIEVEDTYGPEDHQNHGDDESEEDEDPAHTDPEDFENDESDE